jgi:diadenosine tetraphosphate (Ap4A) HIT family hydrolase
MCQLVAEPDELVVYEDALWLVRPIGRPWGLPGWMLMIAKRHVAGIAHFDEREAASLGPTMRRLTSTLEQVSGALRIYTAALGESQPHFHAHLVPRYAEMPRDAKGWPVFDLERAARAGEIAEREAEMLDLVERYRIALR